MKYDAYLEDEDGRVISVIDENITISDGYWKFTKSFKEWMDLAIDDENKRVAASKGGSFDE